jgi:Ca2+/H+ antiporter
VSPSVTLVLTLSIVTVEVALIAAVMLDSHAGPALGRDTMLAVLMIVLNGVVGLALLLGELRHGEQSYNLQGAVAHLAIIVPLSVIALVLPSFILSTSDGTLTKTQSIFFSLFTILLYSVFLAVQTIRNRTFFVEPLAVADAEPRNNLRGLFDNDSVFDQNGTSKGRFAHCLLLAGGQINMFNHTIVGQPFAQVVCRSRKQAN